MLDKLSSNGERSRQECPTPTDAGVTVLANQYTFGLEDLTGLGYRTPGRCLQRSNGSREESWKNILPVNPATDRLTVISGGTPRSIMSTEQYKSSLPSRNRFGGGGGGGGDPGAGLQKKSSFRYVSAKVALVFQERWPNFPLPSRSSHRRMHWVVTYWYSRSTHRPANSSCPLSVHLTTSPVLCSIKPEGTSGFGTCDLNR
jgi:hypothetical protein